MFTRTDIESIRLVQPRESGEPKLLASANHITEMDAFFDVGSVADLAKLQLDVEYFGEFPRIRDVTPVTRTRGTPERSRDRDRSFVEFFARRARALQEPRIAAATDEPKRTFRRFFFELDQKTNPGYLRATERESSAEVFHELSSYLTRRTARRARLVRIGMRFLPDTLLDHEQCERLDHAQGILRQTFEQAFGSPMDSARLRDCFRAFVEGELALPEESTPDMPGVPSVPDGIYFFSFAELIFLILDLRQGCHNYEHAESYWDFWKPALAPLVMCAEVFTELYWSGGRRDKTGYGYDFLNGRRFGDDRWAQLAARFESLPDDQGYLEELFGHTCERALSDDANPVFPFIQIGQSRPINRP